MSGLWTEDFKQSFDNKNYFGPLHSLHTLLSFAQRTYFILEFIDHIRPTFRSLLFMD